MASFVDVFEKAQTTHSQVVIGMTSLLQDKEIGDGGRVGSGE